MQVVLKDSQNKNNRFLKKHKYILQIMINFYFKMVYSSGEIKSLHLQVNVNVHCRKYITAIWESKDPYRPLMNAEIRNHIAQCFVWYTIRVKKS